MLNYMSAVLFVCMLLAETSTRLGPENKHWEILIDKSLQVDEAIGVALRDLQETGLMHGINFTIRNSQGVLQNAIVVGSPDRNELTARLVSDQNVRLQTIEDPQAYEILTQVINGRRVIIVSGASRIGRH